MYENTVAKITHIKKYLFLLFVKCQVIFQHCAKVGASATNRIELRFWNPEWIPLLFFSLVTLFPILFWLDSQTGQQINGRTANLKTSGFHYCTHVKNFEGYASRGPVAVAYVVKLHSFHV